MKTILQAENVEKAYRVGSVDVHALRGVSLDLEEGEFLAIMGPSGCGKSTLLHLLGIHAGGGGNGGDDPERRREVLGLLKLEDKMHHKPLELSGGEQQRVALARAIVNRPAIILADEPTGNLDSENSAIVLNMFQEMNYRFNQTIIMITHNPEAAAMCRRIVQMRDGQIVAPNPGLRV